MYRLREMYDQYISGGMLKNKEYTKKLQGYQDTLETLKAIIHKEVDEIREHSNLEIETSYFKRQGRTTYVYEDIKIPETVTDSTFKSTMNADTAMMLKSIIVSYNSLKKEIIKLSVEKIKHKKSIISLQKHHFIIKRFNYLIIDKIVEGDKFNIGNGSSIYIKAKKRKYDIKVINWGDSNKFKKELERQGELPFKSIRNEFNEIIGTNGGIPWLQYFTDPIRTMIHWEKFRGDIPNIEHYRFTPTHQSTHGDMVDGRFFESDKRNFVRRLRIYEREHPNYLDMILDKNNR